MSEENGLLRFITCGSVGDGKSTLIGHVPYDSKLLYANQEQTLLLDSQVGSRGGVIDYSLLLDGLTVEREQGITIDVAYRHFTTNRCSFTVTNTLSHEEYTHNVAVGASFANLAVILVDASQGVLVQTRRHARICALMGIRYFVFTVSKVDLVRYDPKRSFEILRELETLRAELGLEHTVSTPVSATEDDNVTRHFEKMPWYQGETFLEHPESVDVSAGAPEAGFYLPVQRVCRPDHAFRGFQGQIEAGRVFVDGTLTALPSGELAMVKSAHIADQEAESTALDQPVTIQLNREVDVSHGCMLVRDVNLRTAKSSSATLLWIDDQKLVPGRDYWIELGTKLLPAIVTGIRHKVDVDSGGLLPAHSVKKNEIVRCEMVLSEPMVLDRFRLHRAMGELILIDQVSHATATCGTTESIGDQEKDGVYLRDGSEQLKINLFDRFYYYPDIHTILRHSPLPVVYAKGDTPPLQSEAFDYPVDFDLATDSGFANIRGGAFAGFGPRGLRPSLLDANGIELEAKSPRDFGKYRRVTVWEKDYEI